MKKISAGVLLAFFCFLSCKKQNNSAPDASSYSPLTADSNNLTLGGSINSIDSFKIYYSGQWTLSISPSSVTWIKLDTNVGTGSAMVHLRTLEANKASTVRKADVLLNSKDNSLPTVTITVNQQVEKQWKKVAPLPGVERIAASSFALGNYFYVGLGRGRVSNADKDLNDFYRYDLASDTWTKLPDFPGGPREFAKGFAINGKGYIAMGQNINTIPIKYYDVWQFDPQSNSWTIDTTFSNIDESITTSSGLFATDTKAYILYFKTLYEFDPTDYSLTQKAAFPSNGSDLGPYYFAMGNKGYQISGVENNRNLNTVYQYDATKDEWTQKNDFPGKGRVGAYSFTINGKGYIACGNTINNPSQNQYVSKGLNDVWEYDPIIDRWTQVADFPGSQSAGVAGVVNGRAIIGTGTSELFNSPFPTKDFWIY